MVLVRAPIRRTLASVAATKEHRLHVRLSTVQNELVRQAADVEGATVSQFVVDAITSRARSVMAERRVILLDDAAWSEFVALLDEPPVLRPNLAKLMSKVPDWRD
jgi:uncharacterized protein (DUF1778 family)